MWSSDAERPPSFWLAGEFLFIFKSSFDLFFFFFLEKERATGSGFIAKQSVGSDQPYSFVFLPLRSTLYRFAAKEAVIKAHPHLRISFEDITIAPRQPDPKEAGNAAVNAGGGGSGGGPPVALIRHIEDGREVVQEALVSISHDADYSTAVCMGMTDGDGRN